MTDKTWGKTVLGWFVVQEGEEAAETTGGEATLDDARLEALAAEGAAAEQQPEFDAASVFKKDLPAVKEGDVDFPAVFEAAGVDSEEQGRITKARELLKSLPEGTDVALKKQIVNASLTAFGVPIEKIIESGVEEIQALEGYIRAGASDTQKVVEESEQRIRSYEQEIAQLKQVMQQRVQEQHLVMKRCNEKKLEIQEILEFFGRDAVERVVKQSPKLVDPSAPHST